MATYKLVASSRSRATEVYQGEDGTLILVSYNKSGTVEAEPISTIPGGLTVRYADGQTWETDAPITSRVFFPAHK